MTEAERQKRQLRDQGRRARSEMSQSARREASARICDTVIRSGFFRRSRMIGCYLSAGEEVDTWPIIERAWSMGKRISAPVLGKNGTMEFCEVDADTSLSANKFGLMEPLAGDAVDPRRLDIVITPMVAFDSSGNRIGMGGGYFDRCFSFLKGRRNWRRPKLIGLAFECQRVESIAPSPWDIGVFCVITETS